MGKLSLTQTQAIAELADLLYSFLPGSGASYTWHTAAAEHDLGRYWQGGSKLPAITALLEAIYGQHRGQFCDFLLTAINNGIKYRIKKDDPVKREEIQKINGVLRRLEFKIPELNDQKFLNALPSDGSKKEEPIRPAPQQGSGRSISTDDLRDFHSQFLALLGSSDAVARGYAFEKFLNEFFLAHGLASRGSFKLNGEQIDGSFQWKGHVFVVEARWRAKPAKAADLYVLRGKAEKAEWTRGMFISINDFTDLAADSFASHCLPHHAGRG